MGLNHVRLLAQEPRCEIVGLCDLDPVRLALGQQLAPGARAMPEDQLLREVDAVVIASPASTHVPLALAALAARKHVLVEKPLASSLDDARRVASAAASAVTVAMVGHQLVFHPAVQAMHQLVSDNTLGEPRYVQAIRATMGRARSDESVLWSFGPHDLSIIDHVLRLRPVSVSASGTEHVVSISIQHDAERLAMLWLSKLHPRKDRRFSLAGTAAMLEFDDSQPDRLMISQGHDISTHFVTTDEPLRLMLRHFVGCIIAGSKPQVADLASALRITAVLDAAQLSLRRASASVSVENGGLFDS